MLTRNLCSASMQPIHTVFFLTAEAGRRTRRGRDCAPGPLGAEIVSLAVHPAARHRGIGKTLLMAAVGRMRRRKVQSIRLMVHVKNTQAAHFYYHRLGFRSTGRIPGYYEDGGTGIRMRLVPGRPQWSEPRSANFFVRNRSSLTAVTKSPATK